MTLNSCCELLVYKCFIKIDENGTCLSDCLLIHNHEKDNIQKLDRQKISNSIKRNAVDDQLFDPQNFSRLSFKNLVLLTSQYKMLH